LADISDMNTTTIKATCPQCGDVDLKPAELRLITTDTLTGQQHTFRFDCRACESHVQGAASVDIAAALRRSGVQEQFRRLPAEVREPHTGEPICEDDVIAFGMWLESAQDPINDVVAA
jgi:hypothetical protein